MSHDRGEREREGEGQGQRRQITAETKIEDKRSCVRHTRVHMVRRGDSRSVSCSEVSMNLE